MLTIKYIYILGVLVYPFLFVCIWFVTFGGAGIRMERLSAAAGLCCHNVNLNPEFIKNLTNLDDVITTTDPSLCVLASGAPADCNPCSVKLMSNLTYKQLALQVEIFRLQTKGGYLVFC